LAATGLAAATGFAAALVSTLGATLAAGFAVLLGIALLLFFEEVSLGDLTAATFALLRVSLTDARARPLVARPFGGLWLTAAVFFEAGFEETFDGEAFAVFKILFLRVFCDTACARELSRPCLMIKRGTRQGQHSGTTGSSYSNCAYNSTFPAKINGLCPVAASSEAIGRVLRASG